MKFCMEIAKEVEKPFGGLEGLVRIRKMRLTAKIPTANLNLHVPKYLDIAFYVLQIGFSELQMGFQH